MRNWERTPRYLITDHCEKTSNTLNLERTLWMTTVVFCSFSKAGTFFFKATVNSNIFLSYMIVSCNDDKGHAYERWSRSRIVRYSAGLVRRSQAAGRWSQVARHEHGENMTMASFFALKCFFYNFSTLNKEHDICLFFSRFVQHPKV